MNNAADDDDDSDDNKSDDDSFDAIDTGDDNRSLHGRSDDATRRNCRPHTRQQQQQRLESDNDRGSDDAIYACIFASTVTKKASELAYAHKKRAMTTPDVIENIGPAFQLLYSETGLSE